MPDDLDKVAPDKTGSNDAKELAAEKPVTTPEKGRSMDVFA